MALTPDSLTAPGDALALIDAAGAAVGWTASADLEDTLGGVTVAYESAAHGDWELRMLRVDEGEGVPGVVFTGNALTAADPAALTVTEVAQGLDLCAGGDTADERHSELRILVPWDGKVDIVHATGPDGSTVALPQVRVRDLPVGFPAIVALRVGAEPPALPQVTERAVPGTKRPLRIRQTGSSIPEVELAPAPGGGHEITIRWPDRTREVVTIPGRR